MRILKKVGSFVLTVCMTVLLLPMALVYLLFFVPLDIVRYRRMPYYRDLHKKYHLFITSEDAVRVYNRIKQRNLTISYECSGDFQYFTKENTVLLAEDVSDYCEQDGMWFVDDSPIEEHLEISAVIEEARALLKKEHQDLPIRILVFSSEIHDAVRREAIKACPYFECCVDTDGAL